MATTAAVLSVLVNADTRQATAALTKYNAQLAAVNEESKKGIEARLGARYNPEAFKAYQGALDKAAARAKDRLAFKAELGANFNNRAFTQYERALAQAEGETKRAAAAMEKAQADAQARTQKRADSAKTSLKNIAQDTLAIGAASVYAAVKFQGATETFQTQAGASTKQVAALRKGILNMAGAVGATPDQLAKGMYHVVSSMNALIPKTKRVQVELHVLKVAAQGAAVGHSDLEETTYALASALNALHAPVSATKKVMGEMNAIVGSGDMTMSDLLDTMKSGLVPAARTFGISFRSVGAALAVMGDMGIKGAEAGTKLRMSIALLGAPSHAAAKILTALGLSTTQVTAAQSKMSDLLVKAGISTTQLANDLRKPNGISAALSDLKTHLEDGGLSATAAAATISRAFGGGRSGATIQLLTQNTDRLNTKFQQIGKTAGDFGGAFAKTQQTAQFQLHSLEGTVTALGVRLGTDLLPTVIKAAQGLGKFVEQMQAGKGAGGQFASAIKSAFDTIKTVVGAVVDVFGGLKNAIEIGLAAFAAYKVFKFGQALKDLFDVVRGNPISEFFGVVSALVGVFAVLSGRQDSAAASARNVAAAWREARAAANGLRDANLNLLQAQLHHTEAQQSVIAAEKQLSVLRKEGKTHTFEYTQAETQLQQARLDEKQSTNDLSDAEHRQTDARNKSKQATSGAIDEEKKHVTSLQAELTNEHKYGASQQQVYKTQRQLTKAREQLAVDEANTVIGQSSRSNKGLATAYQQGATSIREAMKAGVISVSKGLGMISRLMTKAFQALGFSPKDAAKLASQGFSVSQVNTALGGGGFGSFPGHAKGGMVDRPGYFAGEEAPQHPEVILATNPAYRRRNVGLWAQAGGMLGIPGFAGGGVWKVRSSAELASSGRGWTELSPNGNAAARLGIPQNFANSASHWPDFASLGKMYPRGTLLNIAANGRRGTFPLTDVGDGSSFAPAIGLTPAVQAALGGMPSTVNISLASGAPLHPFPGMAQLVSGSGGLSGLGGVAAPTIPAIKVAGSGLIPGVAQGAINAIRNAANKRLAAVAATLAPAGGGGGGGGPFFPIAPGPVPRQVQWALSAAESIAARHPDYGHLGAGWGLSAYDCSSYVSTVMDAAGIWPKWAYYTAVGPINAHTQPGHGKWITIATKGTSGNDAHTMMEIDGKFFESSHTGVGPHQDSGWSEAFDQYRHPAGFAKGGINLGKIGHQPTQAQADMIQAARRKAGGARLWDANGDLAFANGGVWPYAGMFHDGGIVPHDGMALVQRGEAIIPGFKTGGIHGSPPLPPREPAGRVGRGRGRVSPVGPGEDRAFQILVRRTWERLSRHRALPAWAHMPRVFVQRAGVGGFGPDSRPYTTNRQVHFPWNAVHYALSRESLLSDWAKEAIVHEYAHTMQNANVFRSRTLTEGGAQAWADQWAPAVLNDYRNPGDSNYAGYVNAVIRTKGWPWIDHGQFKRFKRGGVNAAPLPYVGSFHKGGIAPHDGMALVQRGEAIVPGFKTGGIPSLPVIDAEITKTRAMIEGLKDALAGKPDKAQKKSLDKQLKDAQATLAKEKTQQTAALAYLSHIPSQATPQQVSATSIANRLQAATNAGNIPGQARALASELTLDRKWLAADKAKLRKINKLLSRRDLSPSQRGALIQDKLALLQEIGSVQSDIGSVESSLGQILTGDGTTGGAGGGDPNQPLIDAMTAQTQAMQALQASLDTQTHYMQSVGEIEKRQAIKALSDMISGQISGQFQSRSTGSAGDGSVARYGSVARA